MTNAEWIIQQGMKFADIRLGSFRKKNGISVFDVLNNGKKIGVLSGKPLIGWLDEIHKEQILDSEEKRYLKSVIRPFRDKVAYISRRYARKNEQYIYIALTNDDDYCFLPNFPENAMYRGMELGRSYTVEELGLYE